jgi:hypothetical protein
MPDKVNRYAEGDMSSSLLRAIRYPDITAPKALVAVAIVSA